MHNPSNGLSPKTPAKREPNRSCNITSRIEMPKNTNTLAPPFFSTLTLAVNPTLVKKSCHKYALKCCI